MCLGGSKPPSPPPPPPPVQAAKAPDTTPLRRRNAQNWGGFVRPQGSTMLTGANGINDAQMSLGGASLLGGGKAET